MAIIQELLIHDAVLIPFVKQTENWKEQDEYENAIPLFNVRFEPSNQRVEKENDNFEVASMLMFINEDVAYVFDTIIWKKKVYRVIKIDPIYTLEFHHAEVYLNEVKREI